jgi:sec-independent protein translocase protein TatA
MGLFDSPWHILIVLLVLVLLFGSAKLPKAAKSMGEAMRIFKKEAQKLHDDEPEQTAQAEVTHEQAAAPPQQIVTGQPTAQEQMASLKQQMDALQKQVGSQPDAQGSGSAAPPTQTTNQPS